MCCNYKNSYKTFQVSYNFAFEIVQRVKDRVAGRLRKLPGSRSFRGSFDEISRKMKRESIVTGVVDGIRWKRFYLISVGS